MKYAGVIVGVLLSSVFVFSCKGGLENQARDIVSHYVGKTVVFPDGLQYRNVSDTICLPPQNRLKLIVYINGECGACMEQFVQWSRITEQITHEGAVDVVFYVRAMDSYAIVPHLRRINFEYSFYIDPKSDILYLNGISEKQPLLHTFLVDGDNRMVLVGSPIDNAQMLALYKQQIRKLMDKD